METAEISKLFQDNISKVLVPNRYKNIVRRDNNLTRFDILNRILIEIQCPNAYDVRTTEEWIIDNRSIKHKYKEINIILPMYNHIYVDAETGEKINNSDLTPDELNAALKYDIVRRQDSIETTCIKQFYDIRQTVSLDKSKYEVSKPVIKSSSLINILTSITGCTVTNGEFTYYSKSQNSLTVSKQKYTELALNVVNILVDFYMETLVPDMCHDSETEFSEYDMDLLRYTLQYSLDTLFRDNRDNEFDEVNHTNMDKLLLILNIVDSIVGSISESIEYNNGNISKDATHNIEVLKKAEILLDIMEANIIRRKLRGI